MTNPVNSGLGGAAAGVTIRRAVPEDAGEILTLQRAAYISEAQLYGDPFLPPLVESLEQLRSAIESSGGTAGFTGQALSKSGEVSKGTVVLKALHGPRVVGAVRGRLAGQTCLVSRLVVAPDLQGRGIGGALLAALHAAMPGANAFDLFTGHLSAGNLRLYRRHGYRETHRERVQDHLTLVHLRRSV